MNDLYIFVHIQKTGGETIHKHLQKNYSKKEAVWLDLPQLGLPGHSITHKKLLNASKIFFSKFTPEEIKNIKVVYGHPIPYGIEKILGRPAKYITFFREPVSRVVSDYNYLSTMYFREGKKGKRKKLYKDRLLVKGKYTNFNNWFANKLNKIDRNLTCISTYTTLKKLGFTKGKNLKSIIDKFYFIGLTENYSEDALYFYHFLNINKFFIRQNVSKKYARVTKGSAVWEKTIKKLDNSYKLYEMAKKKNSDFKKKHKDLDRPINNLRIERYVRLPFDQVLYDFPQLVHLTSSYLRKRMPGYSLLIDEVKNKRKHG